MFIRITSLSWDWIFSILLLQLPSWSIFCFKLFITEKFISHKYNVEDENYYYFYKFLIQRKPADSNIYCGIFLNPVPFLYSFNFSSSVIFSFADMHLKQKYFSSYPKKLCYVGGFFFPKFMFVKSFNKIFIHFTSFHYFKYFYCIFYSARN